jgi:hypothetical protein
MFISFDLCFLLYYACLHDVHLIVRALHHQKLLPRGVSLQEFLDVDRCYHFHWLWLQVYPKRFAESRPPFSPLIFASSSAFESFLEHSRHFRRLSEWCDLVGDALDVASARCDDFLAAHPHFAASHRLAQRALLRGVDDAFLAGHTRELAECADEWDAAARAGAAGVDLAALVADHGCAVSRLSEAVRTARALEAAPVWRRFHALFAVLAQVAVVIARMRAPKETFATVLSEMPGCVVLVSFVVFNATVARESEFFTDAERVLWCTFEAAVYSTLKCEPVLTCKIASMIDDIAFRFSNRKG